MITGQQDESRLCLLLALTAARLGASTVNYIDVIDIQRTAADIVDSENVKRVRVRDRMTGTTMSLSTCVPLNKY